MYEELSEKDKYKLDEILATFTKALIKNKMDDPAAYVELRARLKRLIEIEMSWKFTHEEIQTLMQVWGPQCN